MTGEIPSFLGTIADREAGEIMAKGKYEEWCNDPDKKLLLSGWARDGLTDEEIAKKIGISRSTLSEWKKKYPDISDTLKRGKKLWTLKSRTPCSKERRDIPPR